MKIVAFDLGSTFAIAMNAIAGEPPEMCTQSYVLKGVRQEKLRRFQQLIGGHDDYSPFAGVAGPIDLVIYERPFARGLAATRMLWGMAGILEAVATHYGYPVLSIVPTTVKKWATGKGVASKEEMIKAAQRLGYAGENEHEADAFCLLQYALATAEFETDEGQTK